MRVLMDGLGLVESPRWYAGRLYFADWTAGVVIALEPGGASEVVARVASLPLCIAWQGEDLLIVDSPNGRLLRRGSDGALVQHADLGLQGWNDIAVDPRGNVFVNRVDFDVMRGAAAKPGTVFVAARDGSVRQVADDVAFPNGMAVTAGGGTLIVADSYRHQLLGFDIAADGGLANRRVWADLGDGVPDGICLDGEGAVWYADVPNRRCVRVAEGGAVLGTVDIDRGAFACALGGSTLYITAAVWNGMTEAEMVAPGSGQVIAVDV